MPLSALRKTLHDPFNVNGDCLSIKKAVRPVKIVVSFNCLGQLFDFEMSDETHKSKPLSLFSTLMKEIDDLPLHPKNKLVI